MRLLRAEFEILQQLRSIPEFTNRPMHIHLLLSGGKDSVALFQLLQRLQSCPSDWSGIRISLTAHHFNHKRRGAESEGDEQHCSDICRRAGVPLKIWRWTDELNQNLSAGENFHALARDWRYKTVSDFAAAEFENHGNDSDWCIATAHHRRDHAETLLHNMLRGCGKSGLKGLAPWTNQTRKLRPLLWLPSALCDDYIGHKNLPHREDSSNAELDYTRNRLRHVVLKELESLNPKTIEHLWNLSADLTSDATTEQAQKVTSLVNTPPSMPLENISTREDLHRFIAQFAPDALNQLTRENLSNIFMHISKCSRTPNIERQYNFALSDGVTLVLTNKHLQIKATRPKFSDSTTHPRRALT